MKMIKLMFGLAAVATAGASMLLAAGPAAAKDVTVVAAIENDVPVARVHYADLNLAEKGGQSILHNRVQSAVRSVCAPVYDGTSLMLYTACQSQAWGQARPQIAAATAAAARLANGTATAQDRALAQAGVLQLGGR